VLDLELPDHHHAQPLLHLVDLVPQLFLQLVFDLHLPCPQLPHFFSHLLEVFGLAVGVEVGQLAVAVGFSGGLIEAGQ
jgi:hypothetical protein